MKVENLSNNRVKFTFEVSPTEFEIALNYAFDKVKEDVEVKGFRKGHVTRSVYENKFGVESLYEEALNHVFHSKYHEMLASTEHQIVSEPIPGVDFAKVNREEAFEVTFEAAIKPEVKLGNYKGIEVTKNELVVDLEEVNAKIDQMLNENVTLELKDGAIEEGDTAIFDFLGSVDGVPFEGGEAKNFELEIGSGQFIPGFEDQMIGMNAGEEKDLDVTFPTEYQEESLQGANAVFNVKLHEVKTKIANELTDEWVASLGQDEKTVADLKGKIQVEIKEQKERDNKNKAMNEALDKLATSSVVDIPVEMFDYEVNQQKKNIEEQAKQYGFDFNTYLSLVGMTEEQLDSQLRADAELKVMNSLLIEAVANAENFEVTAEDLAAKYEEIANMYQMSVEDVKKHLNDDLVGQDIKFAKALDTIYDNLKFI